MTQVSGNIRLVTNRPAHVTQVWLRAPNPRVYGASYVTSAHDSVTIGNGIVSFEALPGPLLMVLVAAGSPMDTVKLIVPDKPEATLRECIEAAGLADDGTLNALERLAQDIPGLVSSAIASDSAMQAAATEAAGTAVNNALGDFTDRLDNAESGLGSRLVMGGEVQDGVYAVGPASSTFPGYDGLVMFDDFRKSGEVVGSKAFSGHEWSGTGSWISDGSVARAVGGGSLGVDAGQSDVTLDAAFKISTAGTGSAQTYRIYTSNAAANGGTGAWATLSVSATGVASTSLNVTVGGSTRTLVGYTPLFPIGFTNVDPTFKTLSLRLKTSGTSAMLDLVGPDGDLTLTGDLTTQEAAGLSTWATVKAMTDTPGLAIDEIGVETSPYTPQEDPIKLVGLDEAGVVSDDVLPERLSQDSLMSLIKSQQVSAAGGGLDILATKLAFNGVGQHSIGVVSDSSMNDGNDSLRLFDRKIAELLPASVRHVYHNWNTADAGWRHTVNSEGEMTPGHDGTVLIDTFSRVTSSLVGSVPDTGEAWSGDGSWSSDGQYARASGAGWLASDAGDRSMSLDLDVQVSLADATDQRMDLILGLPSAGSYGGMMLTISINSTGSLSFVPYVWDGSWTRAGEQIYASTVGIPAASATTHSVSVSISIDIQNISIDVTGPSGTASTTAQMTESQYANSGSWLRIETIRADTSAIALDKVSLHTAPRGPQGDTLDVWNGAIAGAKLSSFDDARIESMFGGKNLDILMVSMGHNHRTQSPADFLDELKSWLDLWKQKHPETKYFIWVSQNPQFPPAASVMAHRERQHAVRLAHRDLGLDYAGGYEALSTQPDGGASLMLADGIHPTTPPAGGMDGEYGAVKVAEAIMTAIEERV